jgi:hypothetical protein
MGRLQQDTKAMVELAVRAIFGLLTVLTTVVAEAVECTLQVAAARAVRAAAVQGQLRVAAELALLIKAAVQVVQGVLHTLHLQVLRAGRALS